MAYFASYADLPVHEDMLRDRVRTDAYRYARPAASPPAHARSPRPALFHRADRRGPVLGRGWRAGRR